MGIVGISRTTPNGTRSGMGFAIAGTSLGAVAILGTCLSAGIFLPALGKARERAHALISVSQIRIQIQAAQQYAQKNNGQYPTQDQWPDAVIDMGLIDTDQLVSRREDGDGISYIYVPDGNPNDPNRILIYEDPKHFQEFVIVGFADGTVQEIPFPQFEQLLNDQTPNQAP